MSGGSGDKKLGQILIDLKLLTTGQLADALVIQEQRKIKKEPHLKLGQLLVVMQVIKLEQLQGALRQQTNKAAALRKMVEQAKSKSDTFQSITAIKKGLAGMKNKSDDDEERTTWGKIKGIFGK